MTRAAQRSRASVLARGLLSLLGIVLIVVGLPVALVVLGGNPLPSEVPQTQEVIDALTRPDDGTLLIGIITVVGWLVWASLTLSFVVEIPAAIRGVPAPRLPGLSWQQGRAAAMTGAVLAMVALGTATATPASAATAAPTSSPASTSSAVTTVTHAAHDAATGAMTPDDVSDVVVAGGEGRVVTVQSGDTLWDIADRELGDGDRYPELVRASADLVQPDGGVLTSADDIHPGWRVMVPVAAQATATPEAPATDGAVISDIDHEVSGTGTGPVVLPDHQGAAPAAAPVVADDTSADPARDRARPAPVAAPGEGPVASSSSEARSQGLLADRGGPSATLGLGLLGGAGALALVEARRRRQRRTRPPGWRVVVPTGAAARAEQWLRATTDVAGHADLDAALTMLAERCGTTPPSLRAARLGAQEIEVYVVEEHLELPAPWVGAGGGTWVLDRRLIGAPTSRRTVWPALVTIGEDDAGARIYLNLDEIGALELAGRPDETLAVLAALAVDLGTSDTGLTAVTVVGPLGDLVQAIDDPRVRHVADPGEVLERLTSQRPGGVEVLLVGTDLTGAQTQQLRGLVEASAGSLTVVTTARGVSDWSLTVRSDRGSLAAVLAPVGMAVRPTSLAGPGYDDLLEVLRTPTREHVPGPEWTAGSSADALTAQTVPRRRVPSSEVDEATSNISQLRTDRAAHVRVLGRPQVAGTGTPPPDVGRATELAALLALHPGSDAPGAAGALGVTEDALTWAAHQVDRWLGTGAGVSVQSGRYSLTGVLLDWQQLRTLVGAALAGADSGNLRAALTLVSGTPFDGVTPGTYGWAAVDRAEMCAAVADIAHELAQRHLRAGEPEAASWAARKGLLAEPLSEMLWRDQLHASWQAEDEERIRDAVARSRETLGDLGSLEDDTTFVLSRPPQR